MSSFVNYFAPLAQDERTPIAREPVKNGLRNRRSIARVARRRAIERQRTEDAQVKQHESLTRNNQCVSITNRHSNGQSVYRKNYTRYSADNVPSRSQRNRTTTP
jgi:hypothetical protein